MKFYVPLVFVVEAEDAELAQAQAVGFAESAMAHLVSTKILGFSCPPSLPPAVASNDWVTVHLAMSAVPKFTVVELTDRNLKTEDKSVMHKNPTQ